MDWATKDPAFKHQLFQFIAEYPSLKSPRQVHESLVDHFTQPGVKLPPGMGLALKAGGAFKGAMNWVLSRQIASMARRFIAGTDANDALQVLRKLWLNSTAHTVTLLGEKCRRQADAEEYQATYLALMRAVSEEAAGWPTRERAETDHLGPIPRVNISIKVSSLHRHPDPDNPETVIGELHEMMQPILAQAIQRNVQLHLDMEQHALKGIIFGLLKRCAETSDVQIGVVLQAYLRSAEEDTRDLIDWSLATGRQITIRLVKGAYWDYETEQAQLQGRPAPVWSRKLDTDACFERTGKLLVDAIPQSPSQGGIRLALGSHNARSIAAVLALLERRGLPETAVDLQMLYGMGDQLKVAVARQNLRLREYIPIGPMVPGMAYLVRRLLENSSNESWLKAGSTGHADPDELLASPHRQ